MGTVEFQAASDGSPVLDAGACILQLIDIEDAEPGQYGPQHRWSFTVSRPEAPDEPILGTDGKPFNYFHWFGTMPTLRSRCRPVIEALYGRPLVTGERPRADLMIGRRMKALIVHVTDANGKTRARISAEIAPKPFPRKGESTVDPVPEPDVPQAPHPDQEARRREILGADVE